MSWWKEDDPALFDTHTENQGCYLGAFISKCFAKIKWLFLWKWSRLGSERANLACISPSSPVASTDHVCCDIPVEGLAAVTPGSRNNRHRDRPECEGGLASTGSVITPPRHSAHQAFNYSCSLPGQGGQGNISVQYHGGSQLEGNQKTVVSVIIKRCLFILAAFLFFLIHLSLSVSCVFQTFRTQSWQIVVLLSVWFCFKFLLLEQSFYLLILTSLLVICSL